MDMDEHKQWATAQIFDHLKFCRVGIYSGTLLLFLQAVYLYIDI
jgi:hypothetical protein